MSESTPLTRREFTLACGALAALDAPVAAELVAVGLKWTPETVEAELNRYEPVLSEFGIKDPLRWARARMKNVHDWTVAQAWWERRTAHWRFMLLGDEPADWSQWLDLDHPALRDRRAQLQAGGQQARRAWAEHVRDKPDMLQIVRGSALRTLLFKTDDEGIYAPDGTFLPDRAEALLEGKVHHLSLPVELGESDYGWVQTTNPAGHFIKYPAMAYYHQREDRWVREFQSEVVAMVLGDNYEPAGYTSVASRINLALPAYLLMKDSPAMSDRFHAICSRWLWAHARQLHAVGAGAYKDNTLGGTARAQALTVMCFPELQGRNAWSEQMWPLYIAGWRRESLEDHCHHHRSMGYHNNQLRRALAVMGMADALGVSEQLPAEFRNLVEDTMNVFVAMSTPARSTPGVNDDITVNRDHRPLLQMAADLCDRDDWRYLATDGRMGTPPPYRSVLLPAAQLAAMRSDWSPNARWLSFKVSPESGHHHPDTLGIQVWAGARKLLIEPYVGDYLFERDVYNQSWWHSTPTLGKTLLPIRGDDPKVLHWETGDTLDYAVGQINVPLGKGQLPARFRRHVFFLDRSYWVVWDEFAGVPTQRTVWENFHLSTRDIRVDEQGHSVRTCFKNGMNLLMRIGTGGWKLDVEETRMWPRYGRDTEPTATLHYEADGGVAGRGFAALFLPFEGREAPSANFERVERLPDGQVRLHVSVAGTSHALTTYDPGE